MTEKARLEGQAGIAASHDDNASPVKILAVGDPGEWTKEGNVMPVTGMAFVAFHQIDEALLDALQPPIVFSPVLARSFDCIELAMLLQKLGYSGEYRAVSSDIPNPDLIEREVRQICPQIDFRIMRPL